MGLRTTILLAALLLTSTAQAQHKMSYRVDKTYGDVVAAVERLANEPRERPLKIPNFPAILSDKDLKVTTVIDPSTRTYTVRIELALQAMGNLAKFLHTIKVTGHPDHYVVESYVDIDWHDTGFGSRIVNCVASRIIPRAECQFLCMEKAKVLEYAAQMETPEVELDQDSWGKVLIDSYRVLKRAMELRQ